ncbi:DUF547 domain-containing protein [Candidatus Margulisiibacteriota bacterium]
MASKNNSVIRVVLALMLVLFINTGIMAAYDDTWDMLLKKYVFRGQKDGVVLNMVNYEWLKKDQQWSALLGELQFFDIKQLKTHDEKLAFWINAYNIAAVKMIVDNYPIKSIKDKSKLLYQVWDQDILNIGGKEYSLGYIEHKILRKMDEPKIHFAIVPAAVSCPDLRTEAYRPEVLEMQLNSQTRRFLYNPIKGSAVDWRQKKINISLIFKWFAEDFGNVREFLIQYLPAFKQYLENEEYELVYMKYDWALNERSRK